MDGLSAHMQLDSTDNIMQYAINFITGTIGGGSRGFRRPSGKLGSEFTAARTPLNMKKMSDAAQNFVTFISQGKIYRSNPRLIYSNRTVTYILIKMHVTISQYRQLYTVMALVCSV